MTTRIIFRVPADITRIAAIIAEYAGVIIDGPNLFSDEDAASALTNASGKTITITFEPAPSENPLDSVSAIGAALEKQGVAYVRFTDGFVEPSRGLPIPTLLIVNDQKGKSRHELPSMFEARNIENPRALLAAGVDPARIARIITDR